MRSVFFRAVPWVKSQATLALESGVDGLITPAEHKASAASLARCHVFDESEVDLISLQSAEDEARAAKALDNGRTVVLLRGWEIIPVENLLARIQSGAGYGLLALECAGLAEAELACTILQRGVDGIVVTPEGVEEIRAIVELAHGGQGRIDLQEAVIISISPAGMGHRVCVDTLSILRTGQGMLTGNSAAFTFLVNAETEHNEYVASRPFRINAGAVHAYALMPGDATAYLEELHGGSVVLIADHKGDTSTAVVGRVKVEQRPMLYVEAEVKERDGLPARRGGVFLQNAETIRLVRPDGSATSVVLLKPGDAVLCRLDEAGRHFGMRISEDIREG